MMMLMLHRCHLLWCGVGLNRYLYGFGRRVFKLQRQWKRLAGFQRRFQTHQHNVLAAGLQDDSLAFRQRQAARQFAHPHHTVVIDVGMDFHFIANRALAAG